MDMQRRHLGEDIYATFDGYQVWLEKSTPTPGAFLRVVALEPNVLFALEQYVRRSGMDLNVSEPTHPTYLGDGVYAEYIPNVISLSVGHHLASKDIYLTYPLFLELQKYVNELE